MIRIQIISQPIQDHSCKYSKTCVKRPLSNDKKLVSKTNYCLMQVKRIAECSLFNAGQTYCRMLHREHSAIRLTCIKLPFVIKIVVLSIFEWPLKTGSTVTGKLVYHKPV